MTITRRLRRALAIVALAVATSPVSAHGYTAGDIDIVHPYAVPTPPGATTAAGYVESIANKGAAMDRLTGATSPLADRVELHAMSMDGDVMRMRAVAAIPVPPRGRVAMAPGNGYHLMLVGIKRPFKVGDVIPVTLVFEKAGRIDVALHVQERGASGETHTH